MRRNILFTREMRRDMPFFDFLPKELTNVVWMVLGAVGNIWWIFTPYVLFFVFWKLWVVYIRADFLSKTNWTLLEIRIPTEVGKPPQAMEQVFAGLYGIRRGWNMYEEYWLGRMYLWFSCEIVGRNGAISFFIWTPSSLRNLVEAQLYAQYPESEIKEAVDYTSEVPKDIPNEEWGMYAFELALNKEDAYPIRTYKEFAIQDVQYEEQKVDPLASLTEVLSKLKQGEQFWIQILIRPAGNEWKEKGTALVDKLIGRKKEQKKSFFNKFSDAVETQVADIFRAFFGGTVTAVAKKPEKKESASSTNILNLSPGERDVVSAVEKNISKLGFDTAIRIVYLAKKDVFDGANLAAIGGAFQQFNDLSLNGFKRVNGTSVDYLFVPKRELHLKRSMVLKYRLREKPGPPYTFTLADEFFSIMKKYKNSKFIFNIEELATIFHIPGGVVTTISLPRIEAKRAAPPINLPLG